MKMLLYLDTFKVGCIFFQICYFIPFINSITREIRTCLEDTVYEPTKQCFFLFKRPKQPNRSQVL